VRVVDLTARYGGEEFAVLLPHTSRGDARIVAERLLRNVRGQTFNFGNESLTVTISIGCADSAGLPSQNAEELIKAADIALYKAKRGGRDRVVTYPTASEAPAIAEPRAADSTGPAPRAARS
jgi:diguanylate cyclase (GGDEF)-like protein